MKKTHTPGPWTYEVEKVSGPHLDWTHIFAHGDVIGVVYRDSMRDNSQANARLIAAAPDLLEALKEAMRFLEVHQAYKGAMTAAEVEAAIVDNKYISQIQIGANSCNTLASFSFEKARAAIKKAEGTT